MMKHIQLIVIFTLLYLADKSQIVPSSCSVSDSIVKIYRKSADKFAVRRVNHIGNTYKDSVAINKQISYQYLKALLAVHNATTLSARDTVVAFRILLNSKIPYDLNSIQLSGDSSKAWVKNLKNEILPCGNAAVDNLISKYYLIKNPGFSYGYIFPSNLSLNFSFKTDSNCYINRLCDRFNSLISQGVTGSAPNNAGMSPNYDILDSINPLFTEFKYKLSWGDCMAGCLYSRYWTFRVYNDCSVEYLGSYGQAVPFSPFVDVADNELNLFSVSIYPNPSGGVFFLELDKVTEPVEKIELVNFLGQVIYSLIRPSGKLELDLSAYPRGVYNVRIRNAQGQTNKKILID